MFILNVIKSLPGATAAILPSIPAATARKPRILLVDDDGSSRILYSGLLRKEGYEVDTASSPNKAIEMLEAKTYELVLTDTEMPEVTGFDLAKSLNSLYRGELPVVLMSGSNDIARSVAEKRPPGIRTFLHKADFQTKAHSTIGEILAEAV